MSEYGADTVEGLHLLPAYVWSEEFQSQQFSKHFEAFDKLRSEGFFIGEFVWNFADFKTAQSKKINELSYFDKFSNGKYSLSLKT
jgi:beta-glucuronidase